MNAGNGNNTGMFMFMLTNNSIVQALFVIGYERDLEIRKKQFDIEKALASLVSSPSVNTNFPDDFNPHAPRVIVRDKKVSVSFSQLAAQLTVDVNNDNGKSLEVIQNSIIRKITSFKGCVDEIIPNEHQREQGLVLTIRYPIDSGQFSDEMIFDYIQSRFFKLCPMGKSASAQFNAGYKTDDGFYITLTVAPYKTFSPVNLSPSQWIDIDALSVVESGVELKIDVNSKPLLGDENKPSNITEIVLKKVFDFVNDKADEFMRGRE